MSKKLKSNHPECKEDEVFFGNSCMIDFPEYVRGLKTLRMGKKAYDFEGNFIDNSYRPIFFKKHELPAYIRIMETIHLPGKRK